MTEVIDVRGTAAVRAEGLTKRYGILNAVSDVSFEVPYGSIFGLIGPNGAGKTTTLNILSSLLTPTSGRVLIVGYDPTFEPYEVRRRLGFMPDVMGLYDDLTVTEYLDFFAAANDVPVADRPGLIDGLLELVDLKVKRDTMVDDLSRGMKQRLSLARALVHDPEVLILDEPASGLDPRARIELRELIAELRRLGKTIVISSHILPELEEICTDVAVMEAGRMLAFGSPRDIRRQLAGGHTVVVKFRDGEERTYSVADEDEQQALLYRLVAEERAPVVEFAEKDAGLEDLFMKITKGIVQ